MKKGQGLEEVQAFSGSSKRLHSPRGKPCINNTRACQCPKVKLVFSRDINYRIKHMSIQLSHENYFSLPSCLERSTLATEMKGSELGAHFIRKLRRCPEGSTELRE